MLGSEVEGTDCGECYVIAVLWGVRERTVVGRKEQGS
jgi:hypothetical protein